MDRFFKIMCVVGLVAGTFVPCIARTIYDDRNDIHSKTRQIFEQAIGTENVRDGFTLYANLVRQFAGEIIDLYGDMLTIERFTNLERNPIRKDFGGKTCEERLMYIGIRIEEMLKRPAMLMKQALDEENKLLEKIKKAKQTAPLNPAEAAG